MEWEIAADVEGYYRVVPADTEADCLVTPEGHRIRSESKDLIAFIAKSLELYEVDVCSGMSPYGLESSFLDFGISSENDEQVATLASAHDQCVQPKSISRDIWLDTILGVSPRNMAVLMCICGNVGLPQMAYDLVVKGQLPPDSWFSRVCAVRDYAIGNSDLIESAAEANEAFGPLILNQPYIEKNCRYCVAGDDQFDPKDCAIRQQFSMIQQYAALSK